MQKILIVDDDEYFLQSIELSLEDEIGNVQIITAYDGKEAWSKYIDFRPNVIITDNKMPNWDGCDLARHVKREDEKTPIILITGFDDPLDESLFNEYIVKPFIMDDLIRATMKYLIRLV